MDLKACPQAVRAAFRKEVGDAPIGKVDRQAFAGNQAYEVDVMLDGRNYEVIVSEDGVLLSKRLDEGEESEEEEETEDPARSVRRSR